MKFKAGDIIKYNYATNLHIGYSFGFIFKCTNTSYSVIWYDSRAAMSEQNKSLIDKYYNLMSCVFREDFK